MVAKLFSYGIKLSNNFLINSLSLSEAFSLLFGVLSHNVAFHNLEFRW